MVYVGNDSYIPDIHIFNFPEGSFLIFLIKAVLEARFQGSKTTREGTLNQRQRQAKAETYC
jgi:hypothetical protein